MCFVVEICRLVVCIIARGVVRGEGGLEDDQSEDKLCATANQKPGIGSKRQMDNGDRKV